MSKNNKITFKGFLKKAFVYFCVFSAIMLMLAFINDVSAQTIEEIASFTSGGTDSNGGLRKVHPSSTASASAIGNTFNATITRYLTAAAFYWEANTGNPVSVAMKAYVYSITGTYGSTAVPNLPIEESTNTITVSEFTSPMWLNFSFTGTHQLTAGTKYAVVLIATSAGTLDDSNCPMLDAEATGAVYGGNAVKYASSAWSVVAGYDYKFTVSGQVEDALVTPTPTPTPTPIPTALSFTLDMRGVGSVTNPSSTTSASGKEWFPKQGLGYAFYGHVWNYTNPYCNGAWTAYATLQRHKSLGNQTADSWADLAADDVTEVTSGALSNGYFNLGVSCQSQVNSVEIYQGWRINGTITGSSATFTLDFLTRWTEQGVVIIEPTGSSGLPTPTPTGYIPVSYGYIVWYIVALIVVLLPAGILGVLFRFGAWGFIIGLAIGAGLGYMLMPTIVPLWLVFVVVIGIVGMLLKNTFNSGSFGGGADP